MEKLLSVRDHILKSSLHIKPKDLLTFAESGTVFSRQDPENQSFRLDYIAHVIVTDWSGYDPALILTVLNWCKAHHSEFPEDGVKFHVDLLNRKTRDVSLKFPVEEIFRVRQDAAGLHIVPQGDLDPHNWDRHLYREGALTDPVFTLDLDPHE